MKSYDYYLFDADGTLFDTTDIIVECFQYVAEKHGGLHIDRETVLKDMGSPLRVQIAAHLGQRTDMQKILDDYLKFQLSIIGGRLQLFPGVKRSLEILKKNGKKLAVVTSRRKHSLGVFLERCEIAEFFTVLISPEDTLLHKPNPEPALKAMELLGAGRKNTVFIGDTHFDIVCGDSAGLDTIFVNWGSTLLSHLPVTPTWNINNMMEIIPPEILV